MQIVYSNPGNVPPLVHSQRPLKKTSPERCEFRFIADIDVTNDKGITFRVGFKRSLDVPDYTKYPARQFARILMGPNFYGPTEFEEEMQSVFLSPEDLQRIANVPWTKDILESPCPFKPSKMVKETHFLTIASVRDEKYCTYWFEWILAVFNPPALTELGNLPPQYATRRATDYQGSSLGKILARFPEM